MTKIKSFTDLYVWQEGHKLVLEVYRLTENFPKSENFCLTPQLRRAILSFTSNIAEGFSRNSKKEKVQFYYIALGSLTETQNQLLVAKDLGYINKEKFAELASNTVMLAKMLNGLIRSISNKTRS